MYKEERERNQEKKLEMRRSQEEKELEREYSEENSKVFTFLERQDEVRATDIRSGTFGTERC